MNNEELADAVEELDSRLERLRVLMEQYFQGIEKIPPFIVQKDVDRRIWVLRREKIRNTGTRFRFQQIIQRYNTFNSYWTRILREIENGTYKRDVLRAKKRFAIDPVRPQEVVQQADSEPPRSVELSMDDMEEDLSDLGEIGPLPVANKKPPSPPPKPVSSTPPLHKRPPSPSVPKILASKVESDDDLDDMLDAALGAGTPPPRAARPVEPPKPEPPKPKPLEPRASEPAKPAVRPAPAQPNPFARPAAAATPTSSEEFRKVYAQYVEARRRNGESTAGLTYENLAKSLKETKEKLKTKSGGKAIDFEVQTKDGKTILKPVVR